MQIQQVNRTDDEKVYVVAKNVNNVTATTGFQLRWVGGAAAEVVSTGGGAAVFLTDATAALAAGVAAEDIAVNGYGRLIAHGLASVAFSFEADKTINVTGIAASLLKAGGLAGSFTSTRLAETLSTSLFKYAINATTTNISGGLNVGSAFIRFL